MGETVPAEITNRHAVMPHAAWHEHSVEMRCPVVEPWNELAAKGIVPAEGGVSDLSEDGGRRATAQLVEGRPLGDAPAAVGTAAPAHLPVSEPLGAPACLCGAAEIEPHRRADSRIVPTFHVDSRDEELGGLDRIEVRQQGVELL